MPAAGATSTSRQIVSDFKSSGINRVIFAGRAELRPVLERPADLGRGEIGIEEQAGPGLEHRFVPGLLEFGAEIGGAAVLPDDRAGERLPIRSVPGHHGLALADLGGAHALPGSNVDLAE